MKILIHALGTNMGGAMRHLTNFLPELGKQDSNREYVVMVRESFPAIATADNIRFEHVPDAACASWLSRIGNDILVVPRRIKREKFSAIVSLLNFGPVWSPAPHIFFQRNSLYYCPYYLSSISGRLKWETTLRRKLAVASMMRADLIVTPSNAMASMIRDMCPETRYRRFHTLYHGFSRETLQDQLEDKFVRMLAAGRGVKILYPTLAGRHKGFEVLFEMLARIKREDMQFTFYSPISDQDHWQDGLERYQRQIDQLGLQDRVVFLGRVPYRQMGALYKQCDLMVYPSLCESFGFSMIEALGHGLPIVAAGTGINREICDEGALYYHPLDADEGARKVIMALQPEVRARLKEGGEERIRSFDWSWQRYTKELIRIMDMVL
jgi:glycosyltransferase involved in cell wall biosynthesis